MFPEFKTEAEIPEAFRGIYSEVGGVWKVDAVPGSEVAGLKRKAADLLAEKKRIEERYAGIDPEEVTALRSKSDKATSLESQLAAARAEAQAEKEKNAATAERLRTSEKRTAITTALTSAEASVDLLTPVIERMVDVEEENGRLHVVVRDSAGNVRYKDSAGNRLGVEDLVAELAKDERYAPAFLKRIGSGGGAPPSRGGGKGVRVIDRSDTKAVLANIDAITKGEVVIRD